MTTSNALPVVIVKTGTATTVVPGMGDFEHWIAAGLGDRVAAVTVDVANGETLPEPGEVSGAVVTGSSAMVTDREPWSESAGAWLARASRGGLPVLGICYGHQLVADALGGTVGDDPRGREIGMVTIRRTPAAADDPLLSSLPDRFDAQTTHQQSVLELPPGAVLLATGDHTPIQAFRSGPATWGVQFHPEFEPDVTAGYLRSRADALRDEGIDAVERIARLAPTPDAAAVLARFAGVVLP